MLDDLPRTFVLRLRSHGFSPSLSPDKSHPYPRYIDCLSGTDSHRYPAYILGYQGEHLKEYIEQFRSWEGTELSQYRIAEHRCLKSLGSVLPARASSVIKKDEATFEHYERIGLYRSHDRDELIGITHIRHVLTAPTDYSYYHERMDDGKDKSPVYKLQIMDAWTASEKYPHAATALSKAIVEQAWDHLLAVDWALPDPDDTDESTRSEYMMAVVQAGSGDSDSFTIAGMVAAMLSRAAATEFGNALLTHLQLFWSVVISPISEEDETAIRQVLAHGKRPEPAPLPRADVGALHCLFMVTDKELIVTPRGDVALHNSDISGTPLRWCLLLDDATRMLYAEPVFTEGFDVMSFLNRAWERKPDLLFEGRPAVLSVPKSHMVFVPGLDVFLKDSGIELRHPRSGFASGIRSASSWQNDVRWGFRQSFNSKTVSPVVVRQWCRHQQIVVAGFGWFKEHDMKAGTYVHRRFGSYIASHSASMAVDTKSFAAAMGRTDAEDIIKKNWPTDKDKKPHPVTPKEEDRSPDLDIISPNARLRLLRTLAALTCEEFAPVLGYANPSSIASLETGHRELRDNEVRAIAAFFHVTEEWVTRGSSPMFPSGAGFFNLAPKNISALGYVHLYLRENLKSLFRFNRYSKYLGFSLGLDTPLYKGYFFLSDADSTNLLAFRTTDESISNTIRWVCEYRGMEGRLREMRMQEMLPEQGAALTAMDVAVGLDLSDPGPLIESVFRVFGWSAA